MPKIISSMDQVDVLAILKANTFKGLDLVKKEDKSFTYRYKAVDLKFLTKSLGKPTVLSNKKVFVYTVDNIFKLAINPEAQAICLKDLTKAVKLKTKDNHLSGVEIPEELIELFYQAQSNHAKRIPFMKSLWLFFNKEKFGNQLKIPTFGLLNDDKTRGLWTYGSNIRKISLSEIVFNARPAFLCETFLHEMCHQAATEISKIRNAGHGHVWKSWMVKVGLKPRVYDESDSVEYMDPTARAVAENELTLLYGPRLPSSDFDDLVELMPRPGARCTMYMSGRLVPAVYLGSNTFKLTTRKGPSNLTFKVLPTVYGPI
jgi:hypothetical protein